MSDEEHGWLDQAHQVCEWLLIVAGFGAFAMIALFVIKHVLPKI